MQDNKEATIQMPVDRISQSSVGQLLRNPLIWKLKHVLGIYDGKMSISGMIGRAGHEALKVYYGGNSDIATPADKDEARALAIDTGLQYLIDYSDAYIINYGKTGSREEMLKGYTQAMQFYFAEEPDYNEIVMCEEKMTSEIRTVDGDLLPLPAVGIPDIVDRRKDGGVDIVDTKFVKSFTDYETEDYIKIFQAYMLWHLLKATKNIVADKCIFREIKRTANKDGSPQVRDYVVPLNHEPYRIFFYNLYRDVVAFISVPNQVFLPNLGDNMDGEQAGELYAQGLLSADMSDVEVMHKVKDVAFVSKKFVPSRLDSDINKHLLPEEKIKLRLAEFGIPVEPVETQKGTSVTQYRFKVSAGIPMSRFAKHKADIARAIEAKSEIRILAPIPGTDLVGIEVASAERSAAVLTDAVLVPNTLSIPVGVTVNGEVVKVLLSDMPHLLIAGATGSGKSVLLHAIITALTKQLTSQEMRMMMIDPKRVELAAFKGLKHLKGSKIAYEYADAMLILRGLSAEMERRYKMLEKAKARDITGYNAKVLKTAGTKPEDYLPYIVLVVDEFADLIHQSKQAERKAKKASSLKNIATRVQVEAMARQFAKMGMPFNPKIKQDDDSTADELLARLAAMARAVGIHLIIATQRPSIDVITGLIKANFPTRIALTTASATDSKVILGEEGAEKLSGKGDMIFMHPGGGKVRLQGFLTE